MSYGGISVKYVIRIKKTQKQFHKKFLCDTYLLLVSQRLTYDTKVEKCEYFIRVFTSRLIIADNCSFQLKDLL
jgi:hypothetical protein